MFRPLRPRLDEALRAHWARVREGVRNDAGYSTEAIIVTALLAILGLTAVGIIAAKVIGRANGIDLGG
ncbi:hypothetical protein [Streptomyces sp. N35]|uniref:hypothetical protein n=1 Tax=Streptomyces sp. N35 TaxID=2795730 RepID=UPI0018F4F096|nr:hypothetical protein [Streptomyces sp. N35]